MRNAVIVMLLTAVTVLPISTRAEAQGACNLGTLKGRQSLPAVVSKPLSRESRAAIRHWDSRF